jgi:hypothetical protein
MEKPFVKLDWRGLWINRQGVESESVIEHPVDVILSDRLRCCSNEAIGECDACFAEAPPGTTCRNCRPITLPYFLVEAVVVVENENIALSIGSRDILSANKKIVEVPTLPPPTGKQ